MNKDTTTDDLVALIYQTAFDPQIWQDFCDALSARFRSRIWVGMQGFDNQNGTRLTNFTARIDREFIDSYVEYFGTRNPWMKAVSHGPVGKVQVSEEILPFEELIRTEMYNDWLKPQEDIATGAGVTLFREADRFLRLSCNIRLRDRDRFQMPLADELERLVPHMRCALEMTRRLAGIPIGTDVQSVLEAAPCPVFLLDGSGRIVHANTSGERELKKATVVRSERDRLFGFVDPEASRFVQTTLADIATRQVERVKFATRVRRPDGPPLQVLVAPYDAHGSGQIHTLDFVLDGRPVALVTLEEVPVGAEELQAALQLAFGLTTAEVEIVEALRVGKTLNDIAMERGTTLNTVRNQLKSTYGKTGVSRQADLVRICADLVNPRRRDS